MGNSALALKAIPANRRGVSEYGLGRSAHRTTIERYKSASRRITAGTDLFRPGEPCEVVYYLADGCVFLNDLLEDGRRQILHFVPPGGLLGLYPNGIAIYGAQALTDATVHVISRVGLRQLFEDHPATALHLLWTVCNERNGAYDHLSSVGRRSSRERIARFLLELFVCFRMRWPHHSIEEMHLPLTQEHIGDATGLTNVHVNRVLRQLREEGIAEFHYRRLRIMDPDRLADVAGIDPRVLVRRWGGDLDDDTLAPIGAIAGLQL